MATATAITGVVSLGASLYQTYEGKKRQKEAERELNNYQRQELSNAYEDIQVSQLGANLRREELARSQASSVDALRQGGVRGLVGGLGQVQAQGTQVSRDIAANLDEQQKQIDFARAQDDTRIRDIQEQREIGDIAGLGQAVEVGRQDAQSGTQQALASAHSVANAVGDLQQQKTLAGKGAGKQFQKQIAPVGSLSPQGTLSQQAAGTVGGAGYGQIAQRTGGLGYKNPFSGHNPVGYQSFLQ